MKACHFKVVAGAAAIVLCAAVLGNGVGGQAQIRDGFGVGVPDGFLRKYVAFRAAQLASGAPQSLRVRLGYVKGLSRSFTSVAGEFSLDLVSGAFSVSLRSLTPSETYGVWLVDAAETDGTQPVANVVVRLVTVRAAAAAIGVTGVLNPSALKIPAGFSIDRVVVAPGVSSPDAPLAMGSVNVFQKIFFRRLSLLNESAGSVLLNETTSAPRLFSLIPDLEAGTEAALTPRTVRLDRLISRGAVLFFEETFGGNGRTCGTCHPASNNFTIDPDFIKTLPGSDPLFVAEFNPALAQLERPQLMRSFGLILENLDGLEHPATRFVMRGVPHTLGLQASLESDTLLPNAPAQMTGWSGDGAPGSGSLRDFATGAVTQHFTRTLERVAGRDFRLPGERQLDAMETFQLSLGRSEDFDLSKISFLDLGVQTGRSLFINGTGDPNAAGTCNFCHTNGGAISADNNTNRNFITNVEKAPHPARLIEDYPGDGGFGQAGNADGTFGDLTFNIASVVEAADTPPFFHNNIVNTLEEVVEFYSSAAFNDPLPTFARFSFNRTQVEQIADFMRGLNVLQNIDNARRELREILTTRTDLTQEQDRRLLTAFEETGDSIAVLRDGRIFPVAVTHLVAARGLLAQAQSGTIATQRRALITLAIAKLVQGRNAVATER